MYATGNKKMLNMLILEVLREYTDAEHRLTQQEVIDLLRLNYGMECDRRSVKANILSLQELGYEISTEKGCCLMERDFEDAELRLLIDAVLFSHHMTTKQAQSLIAKLKKQSNRYFSAKVSHVSNLPSLHHGDNTQLLYVLDTVNDAISRRKKISFVYNEYGTDLQLHPRRCEPYLVNPYQMVANNGRYYLICNVDKYDNIAHFRLDKMTCVTMTDTHVKDPRQVQGMEQGFDLPRHMAEHIYMFSGKTLRVRMKAPADMTGELIDWFGKDIRITPTEKGCMEVTLQCNEDAIFFWSLQYGPYIEILQPTELRNRIREAVEEMREKYRE